MATSRTYRTVGTYEPYGSGFYLEAKLQVRVLLGLWKTVAHKRGHARGASRSEALQQVRAMRRELADAHGFVSSLPPSA